MNKFEKMFEELELRKKAGLNVHYDYSRQCYSDYKPLNSTDYLPRILWYTFVFVFCIMCAFLPMAYIKDADAIRAAESSGFTDIKIVGKEYFFVGWYGCSSGDAAVFKMSAKNAQEKPVQILVCSGWPFKGSTIRIQ